jgi:nucleoside-diphosphate-sugar epimerase
MVSKVYEHFGLNFKALKTNQKQSLIADTTKINKLCNWNPKYTLESGIDQYIQWASKEDFL